MCCVRGVAGPGRGAAGRTVGHAGCGRSPRSTTSPWWSGCSPTGSGGRVRNTLLATGRGVEASYDKIHLFDAFGFRESRTVAPGVEPVTFDVDGVTIGLATCYDVRFPGLFQALADQGALITLLPASWGAGPGQAGAVGPADQGAGAGQHQLPARRRAGRSGVGRAAARRLGAHRDRRQRGGLAARRGDRPARREARHAARRRRSAAGDRRPARRSRCSPTAASERRGIGSPHAEAGGARWAHGPGAGQFSVCTAYCRHAGSTVAKTSDSVSACTTSIRSNGSR